MIIVFSFNVLVRKYTVRCQYEMIEIISEDTSDISGGNRVRCAISSFCSEIDYYWNVGRFICEMFGAMLH